MSKRPFRTVVDAACDVEPLDHDRAVERPGIDRPVDRDPRCVRPTSSIINKDKLTAETEAVKRPRLM